jgi:hypothetical protein
MALLQKGYLGATPLFRDIAYFQQQQANFVGNAQVSVTTGSVAHTEPASWTQLIASTPANASFLALRIGGLALSANNTATLLDIGAGASGSETAILTDVAVGGAADDIHIYVPFKIASGTRLSARARSAATSRTFRVDPFLYDFGDFATAPTSVDVIGADTATSQGISFSGSSGTWVQAVASTSQSYRAVCLVPSVHDTDIASVATTLDVGVGSSGNEVAFGTMRVDWLNSEAVRLIFPRFCLFSRSTAIPAGSRLAVKHAISANPSKYGFCLIGIP